MVRRHLTALVALFALVSANSLFALGLGEMTLKSYLNQRFNAEIEITDVGDLNHDEIIPSLASTKDFENVGIQKEYFLNQLRFEVVLGDDRSYIKVTSQEPVIEPYLNFLVELLWPEGRILREFTVLLDPPSYAAQREAAMDVPVVQLDDQPEPEPEAESEAETPEMEAVASSSEEVVEIVEQEAETTQTDMMAEASQKQEAVMEARKTITTKPKDTLWGIASRERPNESVSVQQTMLAIKSLNPEAFEHDNINYLKKNQVLRIPSEDEIRSMATREALGVVADQNREWAGRTLASGGTLPMDTAKLVGSRQVTPMEDGSSAGDQMKVVAESGSDGSAVGSYEGSGDAATADSLAHANRQNARLASDLADLKTQVETTQRMIALKDKQIAELQARLAEQGVESETSYDSQLENLEEQAEQTQTPDSSSSDSQISEEDEVSAALAQAQADAASSEPVDGTEFKADEQAAQALETQAPANTSNASGLATQKEDSSSGMMLYAILGVVALLVLGGAGFFLYKRRLAGSTPSVETDFGGMPAGDLEDGFDSFDDLPGDGFGHDDSNNLLTEADTLISFDKHEQAVELLESAIAEGNDSVAVKMRLLAAYAGLGNQAGFDAIRAQVLDLDASMADEIDELEEKMSSGSGEDEFDISLDDLANDLDASFVNSSDDTSADEEISLDDFESSLDLDVADESDDHAVEEISFEADLEKPATQESSSDDDFDLDLDFSDAEDVISLDDDTASLEPEGDELSLDLDLETVSESEDDDSLDLSVDELSFDDEPAASTEDALDLSLESEDELDLSFDDEPVASSEDALDLSLESEDELDLSFDDEPVASSEDALDLSLESEDELDLSFDDEPVASSEDALDLSLEPEDEIDLSFDDEPVASSEDALDLSLETEDEIDLSFDDKPAASSEETLSLVSNDEDALDLSVEEESDEVLDLSLEDESNEDLSLESGDDELSLETLDSDDELDLGGDLDLSLDEVAPEPEASDESESSLFEEGTDDDFDLPDEGNEAATKLDLARAYIDMGDEDGAKDILQEVLAEGDDAQKAEANELLAKL